MDLITRCRLWCRLPCGPWGPALHEGQAVPAPSFGTELAWEVGEEQVRELRRKRAAVRVEVLREQELLGHKMLDIRTAVRVSVFQDDHLEKKSIRRTPFLGV